jgi:hypothetical protein
MKFMRKEIKIMKRQIRRGVFETNSSSVHSITLCMESDYEKWKNGELIYNRWADELVPITDEVRKSIEEDERDYLTYEQFGDWDYIEYETFVESFTTPGGEKVVSFGYYGSDY